MASIVVRPSVPPPLRSACNLMLVLTHHLRAGRLPREMVFCSHALHRPEETLVVADTKKDDRLSAHPLVEGAAKIRFYAGAPLKTPLGVALGTICVMDTGVWQSSWSGVCVLCVLNVLCCGGGGSASNFERVAEACSERSVASNCG